MQLLTTAKRTWPGKAGSELTFPGKGLWWLKSGQHMCSLLASVNPFALFSPAPNFTKKTVEGFHCLLWCLWAHTVPALRERSQGLNYLEESPKSDLAAPTWMRWLSPWTPLKFVIPGAGWPRSQALNNCSSNAWYVVSAFCCPSAFPSLTTSLTDKGRKWGEAFPARAVRPDEGCMMHFPKLKFGPCSSCQNKQTNKHVSLSCFGGQC